MAMDSGAVNIFVTGPAGVGKTALILKVVERLPKHLLAGFYTVDAISEETGDKIGHDIITFSGVRAPLSRNKRGCGPKVGKQYFAQEEFERVVLPELTQRENVKLHILDEIGRLPLSSEKFCEGVSDLLASPKAAVFGSLPTPRHGHPLPFVDAIKARPGAAVMTLTRSNRDSTAEQLAQILSQFMAETSEGLPNPPTDLDTPHMRAPARQ
jgi:nucleoside-triphosphatase